MEQDTFEALEEGNVVGLEYKPSSSVHYSSYEPRIQSMTGPEINRSTRVSTNVLVTIHGSSDATRQIVATVVQGPCEDRGDPMLYFQNITHAKKSKEKLAENPMPNWIPAEGEVTRFVSGGEEVRFARSTGDLYEDVSMDRRIG